MSQLGKSTPKMRRSFTPRVKSVVNVHNIEPKRQLYFTDKKQHLKHDSNPEIIEYQISKKLNLEYGQNKAAKFDIANMNTEAESPYKQNRLFSNDKKIKQMRPITANNKQIGRNIQWTAANNKHYNFNEIEKKDNAKISRCMSAQSIQSTISVRTEKSNKIKQSREQFNKKFNVALDYLMTINSQYLNEKLNMCNQKARPMQKIFTVKRPSISTTNMDFYKKNVDKHKLDIEPQNQKMSLLNSESKVCGNSTMHEFHNGSPGKRDQMAKWLEGFKLQGPIYQITTNSNAYPNHGDFQKMVPVLEWNEHPLGMKHRQSTTSSKFFKGEYAPRSELATWNNLNPIANERFNPRKGSVYGDQFGKKQKIPIQQWAMPEHKLIATEGKFTTEMGSSMRNFNNHELNVQNICRCPRKKH